MLDYVSKHKIRIRTNVFRGLYEVAMAVDLAHAGKMQGKAVVIIDDEAMNQERQSGLEMV